MRSRESRTPHRDWISRRGILRDDYLALGTIGCEPAVPILRSGTQCRAQPPCVYVAHPCDAGACQQGCAGESTLQRRSPHGQQHAPRESNPNTTATLESEIMSNLLESPPGSSRVPVHGMALRLEGRGSRVRARPRARTADRPGVHCPRSRGAASGRRRHPLESRNHALPGIPASSMRHRTLRSGTRRQHPAAGSDTSAEHPAAPPPRLGESWQDHEQRGAREHHEPIPRYLNLASSLGQEHTS